MTSRPSSPRWWFKANVGPELVALALTVALAIVIVLVAVSGASSGDGASGSPGPSSSQGAFGSPRATPSSVILQVHPGRGDVVKYHHLAGPVTPMRSHQPV